MSVHRYGCPRCGSDELTTWFLEPMAYHVPVIADSDGEPVPDWGSPTHDDGGEIGDGGTFDNYSCGCGEVELGHDDLVPLWDAERAAEVLARWHGSSAVIPATDDGDPAYVIGLTDDVERVRIAVRA